MQERLDSLGKPVAVHEVAEDILQRFGVVVAVDVVRVPTAAPPVVYPLALATSVPEVL